MPHYSEKREMPERASDVVRKWEGKHPIKTGESVSQLKGTEVSEETEADNPQASY